MAVFNEILGFYIIFLEKNEILWYYYKVKIFPVQEKSVEFKRWFFLYMFIGNYLYERRICAYARTPAFHK